MVQAVVNGELAADAQDHSRWIFRDANKVSGKNTVKLVVQTDQGDLSKTIEMDGHPLTPEEQTADAQRIRKFLADPYVRRKQHQDQQHDSNKARSLTEMLPDGFLWTTTAQHGAQTTLAFKPNPNFNPPTRDARVFAAMEGAMVVDTAQRRIVSLKGRLTHDVRFGLGLLADLRKGGTFDVERSEIAPKVWQITATHIHINGRAFIFNSIAEQQDEETSDYRAAPPNLTLRAAANMLNDGTVAKELGVTQ